MNKKGQSSILILVGILVLAGVAGGAYFLGKSTKSKPVKVVSQTQPISQPTSVSQPFQITPAPSIDETVYTEASESANWKIYSSSTLSFKYPTNLTLEERQKNYIVLLSDANHPQSVLVSVDARQSGNYANYDKAVSSTKAGLTNVLIEEMTNGVKISGKVGPGYGEGMTVTIVLFKYGTAAVEVETTATDLNQLQVFNQILSTFKFLP